MSNERGIVTEETRNSKIRKVLESSIDFTVRRVHNIFPNLSANDLTTAGIVFTLVGSILAMENNKKPLLKNKKLSFFIPTLTLSIGHLFDLLDGSMARLIGSEDSSKVDFNKGGIYDVIADRTKETIMTISRIYSARRRGGLVGSFGEKTAIFAGISSVLPSIARSITEEKGIEVSETAIGASSTRTVLGTFETVFPEIKGFPIQPFIDLFITAGSIKTARDRLAKIRKEITPEKLLSEEKRNQAKIRKKTLFIVGGTTIFAISAFTIIDHMIKRENKEL